MEFKKAVKTKSRLRLAIDGISGSGKTYTALAIASGMGGPIALIDSEHGSASLYADRFEFDTVDLMEFQIENYIEAIKAAGNAGYPVLIIDSTSHAWDALVERVDRIASTMTGGNTSFRAWTQGTPLQKQLIETMLNYPGHVIVTCRSKTEYSVEKDDNKKTTINKVGLAAVQRQGFEYEFTMTMTMDANHVGHVTKDRTSKFQDKFITKPGKEFGQELIAWLNDGAPPPPPSQKTVEEKCKEAMVEIGNVMTATTDEGERYFSEDEIKKVKEKLTVFLKSPPDTRFESIRHLLHEQKEELHKRIELFESVGGKPAAPKGETDRPLAKNASDNARNVTNTSSATGSNIPLTSGISSSKPEGETAHAVPAMYDEPESEENAADSAAGDDGFQSFSEDFRKNVQERQAAYTSGTADSAAELDIF